MKDDTLFIMPDNTGRYTTDQIVALLRRAQEKGFNLDKGCVLEGMSIRQLDNMINGIFDA